MTMRTPQQQKPTEADDVKKKRRRSSEKKTAIDLPILPQDVIFFHIFTHLPAYFLLLLRSLSLSSLQHIDQPHLARRHAALAPPHLLFLAFNPFHLSKSNLFALKISRGRQYCRRNRITPLQNFPLGVPNTRTILASCHGLLLLDISSPGTHDIVVANPVTKRWRRLSKPLDGPCGPYWQCLYGFVFDSSCNRYKVVHLFRDRAGSLLCEVLTLGSSSEFWRLVAAPKPARPDAIIDVNYMPVIVGEILHWVDGRFTEWSGAVFDPSQHEIISMDVTTEQFRRTRPPTEAKGLCRLLELGGYLALLGFDEIMIHIWVLRDYETELWVKSHSTTNKSLVKYLGLYGLRTCFELSASLHDGKVIVFKSRNKLFKYDLELDSFQEVTTHYGYLGKNPKHCIISNPCVHVDSLVWPWQNDV